MPIPPGTLLGTVQVTLPGAPVIGQVDPDGRLIHLHKLTGWWDPPGTDGTKVKRPNEAGVYLGPANYNERVVGVTAHVDGYGQSDSLATAQRIVRAMTVDSLGSLVVAETAETLQAMVRQEGDPLVEPKGNRVTLSLSLVAPDPRRYTAPVTVETGPPSSTGGLSVPFGVPFGIGATVTSGVLAITNIGDAESFPAFTVKGPCGPGSIIDGRGRQLRWTETLGDGRTLVLDSLNRTALADGVASRVVTGTWPSLLPGQNQIYFNPPASSPNARLAVTYSSARR